MREGHLIKHGDYYTVPGLCRYIKKPNLETCSCKVKYSAVLYSYRVKHGVSVFHIDIWNLYNMEISALLTELEIVPLEFSLFSLFFVGLRTTQVQHKNNTVVRADEMAF